ncbi:MAG TPA: GNAT family N-acetyltransferase [Galbitalea sp.]
MISIAIEQPRQDDLLELMRQGDEFTLGLYPPESSYLLGVEELERSGVTVFAARENGVSLGMAALVDRADGTAELKRMFVLPDARGRGIAADLIAALENFASAHDIRVVQLETGPLQHSAIRLYERSGYSLIPNFGKYVGDSNSVCYEKSLT